MTTVVTIALFLAVFLGLAWIAERYGLAWAVAALLSLCAVAAMAATAATI